MKKIMLIVQSFALLVLTASAQRVTPIEGGRLDTDLNAKGNSVTNLQSIVFSDGTAVDPALISDFVRSAGTNTLWIALTEEAGKTSVMMSRTQTWETAYALSQSNATAIASLDTVVSSLTSTRIYNPTNSNEFIDGAGGKYQVVASTNFFVQLPTWGGEARYPWVGGYGPFPFSATHWTGYFDGSSPRLFYMGDIGTPFDDKLWTTTDSGYPALLLFSNWPNYGTGIVSRVITASTNRVAILATEAHVASIVAELMSTDITPLSNRVDSAFAQIETNRQHIALTSNSVVAIQGRTNDYETAVTHTGLKTNPHDVTYLQTGAVPTNSPVEIWANPVSRTMRITRIINPNDTNRWIAGDGGVYSNNTLIDQVMLESTAINGLLPTEIPPPPVFSLYTPAALKVTESNVAGIPVDTVYYPSANTLEYTNALGRIYWATIDASWVNEYNLTVESSTYRWAAEGAFNDGTNTLYGVPLSTTRKVPAALVDSPTMGSKLIINEVQ